ncbi:MAG: hypothetical protein J2P36_05540, partial [Ktedonobacteraceae bacterium]|nr:hypothetical protein [Ktedonobacteraceae bacterium]
AQLSIIQERCTYYSVKLRLKHANLLSRRPTSLARLRCASSGGKEAPAAAWGENMQEGWRPPAPPSMTN